MYTYQVRVLASDAMELIIVADEAIRTMDQKGMTFIRGEEMVAFFPVITSAVRSDASEEVAA